jgi:hypothetical protein
MAGVIAGMAVHAVRTVHCADSIGGIRGTALPSCAVRAAAVRDPGDSLKVRIAITGRQVSCKQDRLRFEIIGAVSALRPAAAEMAPRVPNGPVQ